MLGASARGQQASHAEAMHEAVPFGIEAYPDRPLAAKDVLDRRALRSRTGHTIVLAHDTSAVSPAHM